MSDNKERKKEGIPKEGKEAILTADENEWEDHGVKMGSKLGEEEAVMFHQG